MNRYGEYFGTNEEYIRKYRFANAFHPFHGFSMMSCGHIAEMNTSAIYIVGAEEPGYARGMNGGSASPKTAEAVKQAMDELSYQPSSIARSLRGIRTKIIGVGLSNYDIYLKPHIGRRLMGLQKYLADHGYTVLLITDEKEVSYFDVARRYLQEGLIDAFFMFVLLSARCL